jgi:hypothetical protein
MMCCPSIKCVMSTPLTDDDQTILQAACLSIPLAGPCCDIHCAHHHSRVTKEAARDINTMCATDIMALGDFLDDTGIGYFYMYFPPFCPWAHMSGPNTLVRTPLSYKREGTRR